MKKESSGTLLLGALLIGLGILFLIVQRLPDFFWGDYWPWMFIVLAVAFYLPPLLVPAARKSLAALFVPGSVMLALGAMFIYATRSNDWLSVSFSWTLIPAGVGLGIYLAALAEKSDSKTRSTGFYMMIIALGAFAVLAWIFGGETLKGLAPYLLIIIGAGLLVNSLRR